MKKMLMAAALCGLFVCPAVFAGFTQDYDGAKKLLKEKKYAEAEKAFAEAEEGATRDFQIALAVIGRARALHGMKETSKAVEMLSMRLKDPAFGNAANRAEAFYELGSMFESQGKTKEAIDAYEQGGTNESCTYHVATCNYRLAAIYAAAGDDAKMEKALTRVIDGNFSLGEQIYAACRLAQNLSGKDPERAMALLDAAEAKAADGAEAVRVLDTRAQLCAAKKDYKAAVEECRKIARMDKASASAKAAALNKAAWYSFKYLNDAAAADEALKEAEKLDPKAVNRQLRAQVDDALKK